MRRRDRERRPQRAEGHAGLVRKRIVSLPAAERPVRVARCARRSRVCPRRASALRQPVRVHRVPAEVVRRIEGRDHAERERLSHAPPRARAPQSRRRRVPRVPRHTTLAALGQRAAQRCRSRAPARARRERPVSRGGKKSAASPSVSRCAGMSLSTTGAPQAAASTAGSPKPSASDGETNAAAPAVEAGERLVGDEAGQHDAVAEPERVDPPAHGVGRRQVRRRRARRRGRAAARRLSQPARTPRAASRRSCAG